ncbi:Signal transduction histidine kinase [Eubacterium ruminantium]|nr:Signal transduction histidine kinase [Eubacterium ruminantium]
MLRSKANKIILELIGFICVILMILLYFTKFIKNNYFGGTNVSKKVEYVETQHVRDIFSSKMDEILSIAETEKDYFNIDKFENRLYIYDISEMITENLFYDQADLDNTDMRDISFVLDSAYSINDVEGLYNNSIDSIIYDISVEGSYLGTDNEMHSVFDVSDYAFYRCLGSSEYYSIRTADYRRLAFKYGSTNYSKVYDELKNTQYRNYRDHVDDIDLVVYKDIDNYLVMTSDMIYNGHGSIDTNNLYEYDRIYIPLDYLDTSGTVADFEESILYAPVYESIIEIFLASLGADYDVLNNLVYLRNFSMNMSVENLMYSYDISDDETEFIDNDIYYYDNDANLLVERNIENDYEFIRNNCDIVLSYNVGHEGEYSYFVTKDKKEIPITFLRSRFADMVGDNDIKVVMGLSTGILSSKFSNSYEEKRRVLYEFCRLFHEKYYLLFGISVFLICIAAFALGMFGRVYKEVDGEKRIFNFDKNYLEIICLAWLIAFFLLSSICKGFFEDIYNYDSWNGVLTPAKIIVCFTGITALYFTLVEIYLSVIRRIRRRVIIKELAVVRLVSWISGLFEMASRQGRGGKVAFVRGGMVFIFNIVAILACQLWEFSVFTVIFLDIIYFIINILSLAKTVKNEEGVDRVLNTAKEIGDGNMEAKVDTEGISGSSLTLAWTINGMNDALNEAVEKNVRDEKMKAELITNVSHDIKTPLTSIINYVSLIRREQVDNEKLMGYVDILDSKSQRLKQLIEDLIEASKASSGEIEMDIISLDFAEFLHQIEGESIDRFNDKGINLVTDISKEAVMIKADGRHLFRITENIVNNAYKYSKADSTVYMKLVSDGENAVMTLENLSAQRLEVSAEDLTERFVRGDRSRSTEGSGLGLSIAKSLTELMKGKFVISLSGNVFTVTVTFPLMKEEEQSNE